MILEGRWLVVRASPGSNLDLYIAPDGWSDSNSNFGKENDAKAVNTKRLSLSVASDSKHFIRGKTNDMKEDKK